MNKIIISIDIQKVFEEAEFFSMTKNTLNKLEIEGNFNLVKVIYEKFIVNILRKYKN